MEKQQTIRMEAEIYRLQYAQIRARFGREAAETANYGWFVDADDARYSCSTKVYVDPPVIVTTRLETTVADWAEWTGDR